MYSHARTRPIPHAAPGPARRSPEERLTFRVRRRNDVVVLVVRGEADAFTLPLWRQRIGDAAAAAADVGAALIVDAGRLDFLSLRALAALAEDSAAHLRNGIRICLVIDNIRIARLADTDPRTAGLPIRSTVVGALTTLQLSERTADTVPSVPASRTPWITPDVPARTAERRAQYRAGQVIAGHDDATDAVAAATMPRAR
ncbi:MAG: hypothetical protein HOQ36_20855 [Nocardia sp.]|nr:hypothetical protein [Nocardia sp.]